MKNLFLNILLLVSVIMLSACADSRKSASSASKEESLKLNALLIDAVTDYNNDNYDKAEEKYKQILKTDADNATALYYLATIAFQNGDVKTSTEYAQKASKLEPDNIWMTLQLAEIFISQQDYSSAAGIYEKIVNRQPEVIEYWQKLCGLYHMQGDVKNEIATLDKMEERFGVNEMTSMQKFSLYRSIKDEKNAEKQIDALSKAFPNKAEYYYVLAEYKMQQKQYSKALEYYRKVQETDPDNADLNFTMANYYLVQDNQDSLYHYLYKAAQQKDVDFKSKLNIVFTVYKDKVDEDETTFNRFFSILKAMEQAGDTTECELYSMLNLGYMRMMKADSARYTAQKAIDMGCATYSLYQNLIISSMDIVSKDSVIAICDKAIETYPEQYFPYYVKAELLIEKDDFPAAADALEAGGAVISKKDTAQLLEYYALSGDIQHSMNNNDKAFGYYDKILNMFFPGGVSMDNANRFLARNPQYKQSLLGMMNNYAYYLSLEDRELDKAQTMIDIVIKYYPINSTYLDTQAWVLYKRKEYSKAKEAMDKITEKKSLWSSDMKEHYEAINKKLK